jgi:hypothetical protein
MKAQNRKLLISSGKRFSGRENPIPALKEKRFKFHTSTFSKVCALIARQNRFSRRKNLSNTGRHSVDPLPAEWMKMEAQS